MKSSLQIPASGAQRAAERADHDRSNREAGFRFVRAVAVEKAALDQDLKPADIRVLAAISYFMNSSTMRAWPSYERLREITGYSEDTIDGSVRRLKKRGYIFTERRAPLGGGRALVHYGLAAVSLPTIESMVSSYVAEYRRRASDPGKNSGVKKSPTPHKNSGSEAAHSVILTASDPVILHPQEPLQKEPSNVVVVSTAARTRDDHDQISELVVRNVVSTDEQSVSLVLNALGLLNPSAAQRQLAHDTLRKAALRWEGMGSRHTRYASLSSWFEGEWLPRLRGDLAKLAHAESPRRFTANLEGTIIVGEGEKRFSLTRNAINAELDAAERVLDGRPTIMGDFDAAVAKPVARGSLRREIVRSAILRINGEHALDLTPNERAELELSLVDEGHGEADVKEVVGELIYQARIGCIEGHVENERFPGASKLLLQRDTFVANALPYLRAALGTIARERVQWRERMVEVVFNAYARRMKLVNDSGEIDEANALVPKFRKFVSEQATTLFTNDGLIQHDYQVHALVQEFCRLHGMPEVKGYASRLDAIGVYPFQYPSRYPTPHCAKIPAYRQQQELVA